MENLVGNPYSVRIKYGKVAWAFTFGPIMTEVTYIHSGKRNMHCINFTFRNIVQVFIKEDLQWNTTNSQK